MNNQVLAYANCPVRELKSAVGVVEDQMRRTKALLHIQRKLLHLRGVRHIDLACQHLGPCGLHLGGGGVQRVLLHIDQHQVHAQTGANARAFQPKARTRTGEYSGLARKIFDHVMCLLQV